jgi:hypothetical protein
VIWWIATACSSGELTAGELRRDTEGLSARVQLPPDVQAVRWVTQVADARARGAGRADARVYAWVATPGGAAAWLQTQSGPAIGPRAHWVADAVAEVLFTPGELGLLQRHASQGSWKLACVRYAGTGLGLGDYGAGVVLDCGDHLYITLVAH